MTCQVVGCERRRAPDAPVCREHLNDLWGNRLERIAAGYIPMRVSPWVERARAHQLPGKVFA